MFYSEVLLTAKKGPLGHVWLAATHDRKLSKQNIMQTNIQRAAREIVEENHAPMALRLSGQLLLGVVKIYSRKARYLLEDCNDALMKLKTAFRPGQVDLSSATVRSAQAQAANLILPDTLTEFDLLGPDPGFDLSMDFDFDAPPTSMANVSRSEDITLGGNSLEFARTRHASILEEDEDDILAGGVDLDLDIGMDEDGPSLELGRDAPPERNVSEEFDALPDFDKGDDTTMQMDDDEMPDMPMDNYDDGGLPEFPMEDIPALPSREPSVLPELDAPVDPAHEAENEAAPAAPVKRAKQQRKRRLQDDTATELSSASMRALQEDQTPILKRPRRLPLDPAAMALMQLSASGQLAELAWRPLGLHANIKTLLSPEFVKQMAIARAQKSRDEQAAAGGQSSPARGQADGTAAADDFDYPPMDNDNGMPAFDTNDGGADFPDMDLPEDTTGIDCANEEGVPPPEGSLRGTSPLAEGLSNLDPASGGVEEDETHPFESTQQANAAAGVVAIDTTTAVAQLTEALGGASGGKRARATAICGFNALAEGTTRAAASSLFFQVLLLATKDALKIEQREAYGDIQIKGKPGLYALSTEQQNSQVAA